MKIELKEITIREFVKGYSDDKDGGVVGYDGKLDIHPLDPAFHLTHAKIGVLSS